MALNNKGDKIRLFLFDLEGVLVPKNFEANSPLLQIHIQTIKKFFEKLKSLGLSSGIVTMRSEDELIDELRKNLSCPVITASLDKVAPAEKLLAELKLSFENLFYIGDDLFDIPLLQRAAVSASPSTGHREVKRNVDFIITYAIIEDLFNYILKEIIEKK